MVRIFQQYIPAKAILLGLAEFVVIAASLLAGVWIPNWYNPARFDLLTAMPAFGWRVALIVAIVQIILFLNQGYHFNRTRWRYEQTFRHLESIGAACVLLAFIYLVAPITFIGRLEMLVGFGLMIVATGATRLLVDAAWTGAPVNIAILGSGELARIVADEVGKRSDLNWRLVGFISERQQPEPSNRTLGNMCDLAAVVESHKIQRLIVALEERRGALPVKTLVSLRVAGLHVEDAQTALAALTGRVWLRAVQPSWFVFSDGFVRSTVLKSIKRMIDLVFGLAGFAVSLPIMTLVAIAVRLDSKGPFLYRQTRVGMGGKSFELMKFRSMRVDAEAGGGAQWAVTSDPRLTRIGGFLRKYRLDELPQFINVLRGDMSLVGPRPERPFFTDQLREVIPYYDERHSVRPGITGWAQVCFAYGASLGDAATKLEYDLFYLKNMSILFDFAILFRTVRTVLFGFEWGEMPADHPSVLARREAASVIAAPEAKRASA